VARPHVTLKLAQVSTADRDRERGKPLDHEPEETLRGAVVRGERDAVIVE